MTVRGQQLSAAFGRPEAIDPPLAAQRAEAAPPGVGSDGEPVLFADDVTAGYRVDVRSQDGVWRSLMRRVITYTVGTAERPIVLTADDEGMVDPVVAVQQKAADGVSRVEVGEDVFSWSGYGLAAPLPGASVTIDAQGRARSELVARQSSAQYPLAMQVAAAPGTLPRLRFGQTYQFRVRAVDLAGHSVDPALCDPSLVSEPVHYRRLDPVLAPAVVPRAPFTAGESLLHLVVRTGDASDGSGCERHLAAPKAYQQLAEQHGVFDDALGPRGTPEARARALTLAALEAGSFTDLKVPDPRDPTRRIDAPGVKLVVNADAPAGPKGSLTGLPRGAAPPAGEYVVLDSDEPHLPYLADPLAVGVAFSGQPDASAAPITLPYGGRAPLPHPLRLVAKAGRSAQVELKPTTNQAGRSLLEVHIPPAATLTLQLSSTLDEAGLQSLEADHSPELRAAALAGQDSVLTPRQSLTLVHAVQRPLDPLRIVSASAKPRTTGDQAAAISGSAECHPASTSRIDVVGRWSELIDDGSSALVTEQRMATAGSVTVEPGRANVPFEVRHFFGDTKRRDLSYVAVGSSRFREYFPLDLPAAALQREGAGVALVIPNTARPEPPDVASVLPLFGWERAVQGGTLTSTRTTVGLRVYMNRPWFSTGHDERLAVMVYADAATAEQFKNHASVHEQVTRWAGDPLDGWGKAAPALDRANFPGTLEVERSGPFTALGHAVHYDEQRDKWFADVSVDLRGLTTYFPFLRLVVARYQPQSAAGCHLSQCVVLDPIQLPPARTLTATIVGRERVELKVSGRWMNNNVFEAALFTRAPDPLAPASDSDVLMEVPGSWRVLSTPTPTDLISVTGNIAIARVNAPNPEWFAGRIRVRELQKGESLHSMSEGPVTQPLGGANRAVWLDTVDPSELHG